MQLRMLALHTRGGKNPKEMKENLGSSSVISVEAAMVVAHFETHVWTVRSFTELYFF